MGLVEWEFGSSGVEFCSREWVGVQGVEFGSSGVGLGAEWECGSSGGLGSEGLAEWVWV